MIRYKRLFNENYNFDILTSDVTNNRLDLIEFKNPLDTNWPEPVDRILIKNVKPSEIGLCLNLHRNFGGLPRLNKKGEFQESINTRFITSNDNREILYTPRDEGFKLLWESGLVKEIYTGYSYNDIVTCLCIQAKDLTLKKKVKDIHKNRLKNIRKMGRQKFI